MTPRSIGDNTRSGGTDRIEPCSADFRRIHHCATNGPWSIKIPAKESDISSRAYSGSTFTTYVSGRTMTIAPSLLLPRLSKMSRTALAARTIAQSCRPSGPECGRRISGMQAMAIAFEEGVHIETVGQIAGPSG